MIPRALILICAVLLIDRGVAADVPESSVPRLTHPAAGGIFYFVLTDRFANGSMANDRGGLDGGPEQTGFDPSRISHYHGGDFVGLTAHLDYIKQLGATAVWVTPPFKNKPMQSGSAGYHGYWILDFLKIDPHLGTNEEFEEFVRAAHARGLKVFIDIIANHTADVIKYRDGYDYRTIASAPYRDAQGGPFDAGKVAYNGLNDPQAFPLLSVEKSFAHQAYVPPEEAHAKNPEWLNDITLYHNRGNSVFVGENSLHGDFGGLDDVFTEQPRVVKGFIEIYTYWLEKYGIDGFRIDTVRHVNPQFWQAFIPAVRQRARELGREDFLQFGEVYNDTGDPAVLSEYSTGIPLDTTLDFGFFAAARRYVSQGGTAAALGDFFDRDDYYTDDDSNVHVTTTFLGNHDAGRFAYFLSEDNPGASREQLADLVKLGNGLLLLSRGQPVLYYGDEQGMIGRGGNDMQAREDMFASQSPAFRDAALLGTKRTGAEDKYDEHHPFFEFVRELATLRESHPGLRTGAMIPRATADENVFAFSRVERGERIEYLVALNNSRTAARLVELLTAQGEGAKLWQIFDSRSGPRNVDSALVAGPHGRVQISLQPLQVKVWKAEKPLGYRAGALAIAFERPLAGAKMAFSTREVDGVTFPTRQELRVTVNGGDGYAEVTFALQRTSHPGQLEYLGTDDTPPYRLFWRPPPDLSEGEQITFVATVSDLRGHRASATTGPITVAPTGAEFGIRGAKMAVFKTPLPSEISVAAGKALQLDGTATGTGDLVYAWLRDGEWVAGAKGAMLVREHAVAADGGDYQVLVRDLAGTAMSLPVHVTIIGGGAR